MDEPTNHLDIASREALENALAAYPGTLLFVTHDRYLAQKIATHFVYIEDGRIRTFDRFSGLEEWLAAPLESIETRAGLSRPAAKLPSGLSKNKRDQLLREIGEIEKRISALEREIADLETIFQNPPSGLDWQETHRRYDSLRAERENLYERLASRLELMG